MNISLEHDNEFEINIHRVPMEKLMEIASRVGVEVNISNFSWKVTFNLGRIEINLFT